MSDVVVQASNIGKRFFVLKHKKTLFKTAQAFAQGQSLRQALWVLRGISFRIVKGEKIALVGKNGVGKTTLLRVLSGIYDVTQGSLIVHTRPLALLRLWVGLNADISLVDNIYLFGAVHGLKRSFLDSRIEQVLQAAELEHLCHVPFKELSLGQMQRLGMSVVFQAQNDFLIFDESIGNVDPSFMRKAEAYFKSIFASDKTVLMTSHDSAFLRRNCTRAIWLADGGIYRDGPAQEVLEEYEKSFR